MIDYMSKESSVAERLDIFSKALAKLESDFGKWQTPWGEYNRYQRINGDIVQQFNDSLPSLPVGMASGYWGALASFGTRYGENTKRIYGVGGNSFVAVVEFGDRVKAKTLLAGESDKVVILHLCILMIRLNVMLMHSLKQLPIIPRRMFSKGQFPLIVPERV